MRGRCWISNWVVMKSSELREFYYMNISLPACIVVFCPNCPIYLSPTGSEIFCCFCTFASCFQENFNNHRLLMSSNTNSRSLVCTPCNCAQMALADTRIAYQPDVDKHAGVLVWGLSSICMGQVLHPCANKCFLCTCRPMNWSKETL